MEDKLFNSLIKSLNQVKAHLEGDDSQVTVRAYKVLKPKPLSAKEIKAIRAKTGMSQAWFAALLNVSDKTVKSWEQGLKTPSGIAMRMLEIIGDNPEEFIKNSKKIGFYVTP